LLPKCIVELTGAAIELFAQIVTGGDLFAELRSGNPAPLFRLANTFSTTPSHVTLWAVTMFNFTQVPMILPCPLWANSGHSDCLKKEVADRGDLEKRA
jgi:hypothetical protein